MNIFRNSGSEKTEKDKEKDKSEKSKKEKEKSTKDKDKSERSKVDKSERSKVDKSERSKEKKEKDKSERSKVDKSERSKEKKEKEKGERSKVDKIERKASFKDGPNIRSQSLLTASGADGERSELSCADDIESEETFQGETTLGTAVITVASAKGLIKKCKPQTDPFCELISEGPPLNTKTCKNTLDPVWNETFKISVTDLRNSVRFYIWALEKGKKRFLGMARVEFTQFASSSSYDNELELQKRNPKSHVSGKLKIKCSWEKADKVQNEPAAPSVVAKTNKTTSPEPQEPKSTPTPTPTQSSGSKLFEVMPTKAAPAPTSAATSGGGGGGLLFEKIPAKTTSPERTPKTEEKQTPTKGEQERSGRSSSRRKERSGSSGYSKSEIPTSDPGPSPRSTTSSISHSPFAPPIVPSPPRTGTSSTVATPKKPKDIPIDEKADFDFKVVMLGDSGVGKTSLCIRLSQDRFEKNVSATTSISDIYLKKFSHQGKNILLRLVDTAGSERFRSLIPQALRGAHGALIMFDQTNPKSFSSVSYWLHEFRKYNPNSYILLLGNKIDLKDKILVKRNQIVELQNEFSLTYLGVSAATAQFVEDVLEEAVEGLMSLPLTAIDKETVPLSLPIATSHPSSSVTSSSTTTSSPASIITPQSSCC